jgi:hypothetical protein
MTFSFEAEDMHAFAAEYEETLFDESQFSLFPSNQESDNPEWESFLQEQADDYMRAMLRGVEL